MSCIALLYLSVFSHTSGQIIIIIIIPRAEFEIVDDTSKPRCDSMHVKTTSEASRSHGPWTLQRRIAEGDHFRNITLLEEETDVAVYLILN
jgi:hypothetical protein